MGIHVPVARADLDSQFIITFAGVIYCHTNGNNRYQHRSNLRIQMLWTTKATVTMKPSESGNTNFVCFLNRHKPVHVQGTTAPKVVFYTSEIEEPCVMVFWIQQTGIWYDSTWTRNGPRDLSLSIPCWQVD